MTLKLKGQLQITSALHYRILPYCQSSRLNTHSARKVNAFCKQASKNVASTSLRPLIDTCQKCSTSPANHEPRSPANGGFQNPGVCPQAVPSFPSPTPTVLFLALAPFSAQAKYRKPRSSVFLCSQTLRKCLLRRLCLWCSNHALHDAQNMCVLTKVGTVLKHPFQKHFPKFISWQ